MSARRPDDADAPRCAAPADPRSSAAQVFRVFLGLGLTSFGGPVAHIGYFRDAFVERRRWIDERGYADLVALCQFLPGPASSQVGIGIGLLRAGLPGALAAWVGFTLPSALLMTLLGYGVVAHGDALPAGLLGGLEVVAVAVVAQAVWAMARALCPDAPRASVAIAAATAVVVAPGPLVQLAVIAAGAVAGLALAAPTRGRDHDGFTVATSRRVAAASLALFAALLLGLPMAAAGGGSHALELVDAFYRAGALVFGGGHVVLPLLQAAVVPPGWVSNDTFVAGYGAAQAVPGPLFTFAAYLGTVSGPSPNGWSGALLCLVGIFASSFLLVVGALPFWDALRRLAVVRRALAGVNAAVVGVLLAALYDPVWTSAIGSREDFALALVAFALLAWWKWPPWLVVVLSGLGGWLVAAMGA